MSVAGPRTAVIFDLDGTLVDSLPDIAGSVNQLMAEYGLAPHSREAVRRMIGRGVRNLVTRAFSAHGIDLAADAITARTHRYMDIYGPRAQDETVLFPGVAAAVARLKANGIPMAVCTNKPTAVSKEIVAGFGLAGAIPIVIGGDFGGTPKPAPDMLLAAADALGVAPCDCIMVGDSEADVASARAAGMAVIVVEYGYAAVPAAELGADVVAADFEAVGETLQAWIEARVCAG